MRRLSAILSMTMLMGAAAAHAETAASRALAALAGSGHVLVVFERSP